MAQDPIAADSSFQVWFTLTEACRYLRVSRVTLYRHMEAGLLPYYELKGSRGRRFKREDLDALLERAGPPAPGAPADSAP